MNTFRRLAGLALVLGGALLCGAVAETLGTFSLEREALALIRLLSATGKRMPKAAVDFIMHCDAAPGNFEQVMVDLQSQDESARGVIALVLKLLYENDAEMGRLVARLRSADRNASIAAAREVSGRLARFLIS